MPEDEHLLRPPSEVVLYEPGRIDDGHVGGPTFDWSDVPDDAKLAAGVDVPLVVSRSTRGTIRLLVNRAEQEQLLEYYGKDGVETLRFRFDPPVNLEQDTVVLAQEGTRGEAITVTSITFLTDKALRRPPPAVADPTRARAEALDTLERSVGPTGARAFFLELDRQSNPGLVYAALSETEADRRVDLVKYVTSRLISRLFDRRFDQLDPDKMYVGASDLQEVTAFFLAAIRQTLPDGSGGMDVVATRDAFGQFAAGLLEDPASNLSDGLPQGAFFFLFAELADLAVREGLDPALWIDLLLISTAAQTVYMEAYKNRTGPNKFHTYGEPDAKPKYPVDSATIAQLMTPPADVSEARSWMTQNALDAFPDGWS